MNIFDNLQANVFSVAAYTMGYDASWTNTMTSVTQTARILYKGPTEKVKLKDASYDPEKLEMEYKEGDFAALKDLADQNLQQTVTIIGFGDFLIKSVGKKYDGKTYLARLQPV